MFMKNRFRMTFMAIVAMVIVLVASGVHVVAAGGTPITILHVNDVHGRMDPFRPAGATADVGALSKVAAYVAGLRKNPGANILLLSAGDMVHGTNVVNLFGGKPMIEVMNHMGFDAMTLGNHEFNYGQDQLLALQKSAAFPFLAANVVYSDNGELLVSASTVKEIAGVKVGIFGLSPLETPVVTHPNNVIGLAFLDPADIARRQVRLLEGEADIVVCLSHLGYKADRELAATVPGIDIIVGGHSHTVVSAPERVGDTVIVQAGEWAGVLGELNILVENGKVSSAGGRLIPIAANMPASAADSAVGATLAGYNKAMSDKMAAVVGSTSVALLGERADVRTRTTNLSNLITDAMRQYTNADLVITNGGGIRASMAPGNITVGSIYTVLPFDNSLVVIELTGDKILKALEHGLRLYPEQNGGFAQVAGITVKFDPSLPAGSRVVEATVGGAPLDPAKAYTVATNDFMAAGGDGYEWFTSAPVLFYSGDMLRDVLANYVSERGQITVTDEVRIIPVKK